MEDRASLEAYRDKVQRELSNRKVRLEQVERKIAEISFRVQRPLSGRRCMRGADILALGQQSQELQGMLSRLQMQRESALEDLRRAEERLQVANEDLQSSQSSDSGKTVEEAREVEQ